MEDFKELETELKIVGHSDQTIRTYIYHNKKFLEFLQNNTSGEHQKTLGQSKNERGIKTITQKEIKLYLAHLVSDQKAKPATVNLVLSALKFFYENMHELPIFAGIKRPKREKKLPDVLTKDEVKAMLDATKTKKQKLLIELLYGSGLRVSEAVTLKINQVNTDERMAILRSGKGNKDRQFILSGRFRKKLRAYLKSRRDNNPYIFHYRDNHLSARQAQRIVSNAAKRANLNRPVHCHMLRASFATELLNSGVDIRQIQTILGHEDVSTTQIYTKVSTENLANVTSPLDKL